MPSHPPGIDLWAIDLDGWAAGGLDPSTLSDRDRRQAGRLRSADGGRRLLARRSATRTLLGHELQIRPGEVAIQRRCPGCGADDHGRPTVVGVPIEFSVSSSLGLAVVAVSDGPVGVDVELDRQGAHHVDPSVPGVLTRDERQRLDALPPDARGNGFLRLWTAKEAVLKASGRSLADDPLGVEVTHVLDDDRGVVTDATGTWTVRHLTPTGPAALAVPDRAVVAVVDRAGGEVAWRSLPIG